MKFVYNPFTRTFDLTIGNTPAGSFTIEQLFTSVEYDNGNSGAAAAIDFANGPSKLITLTNNCAITVTPPSGTLTGKITLRIVQDAGGGNSITWPAGTQAGKCM